MSAYAANERFHTIVVRGDLPTIEKQYSADIPTDLPPADHWIRGVIDYLASDRWDRNNFEDDRFKVQHTISNGPCNMLSDGLSIFAFLSVFPDTSPAYGGHAIFRAYLSAYNSHEDIVLSPDDLWLMITIYFAKYANDNAEKLRHLLVNHDGKIKFTIEQAQPDPESWTQLTGWFLQLCYGLHAKTSCNIREITLHSVVAPVEFESEYTDEKKTCYVVGGFHGVESRDEWHKPVMSLAVIDDLSTITKRK
ncbi:unnamed protein product [Adineta steineri]|uniref:Uncharacterized protein n=1 Tax=Adineta steineri TaxID=433720 RepID=A0A819S6C4_9BILA|nr:unnamed protein product [Adineta steineri]CAF4064854.1 unnamed protein product [Adineta steineri]